MDLHSLHVWSMHINHCDHNNSCGTFCKTFKCHPTKHFVELEKFYRGRLDIFIVNVNRESYAITSASPLEYGNDQVHILPVPEELAVE